uniref:Uncharacterized protein n=1 Tax=viral metagenome TaxID=1070528 RepID=A0A6C0M091_9ZZZZ
MTNSCVMSDFIIKLVYGLGEDPFEFSIRGRPRTDRHDYVSVPYSVAKAHGGVPLTTIDDKMCSINVMRFPINVKDRVCAGLVELGYTVDT